MAHPKSRSIVTIHLESKAIRFLVMAPALLAILACWFVLRWYVGNTVAENTLDADPDAIEMARLAARWAPSDPFTHWHVAAIADKNFGASNLAEALHEYQQSVLLSPYDYRYWMELGGGLEATGDSSGAESAMRRAVELAPAYAQPRWFLGNLLLREGKLEEGFDQVRRAAMADNQMQPQLLNTAWQVFAGDVDQIARVACPSPELRIQFGSYLVTRNKIDDAMRLWNALSKSDKEQHPDLADTFKQELLNVKQFAAALQVVRDTEPDPPAAEQFWNGGFENHLSNTTSIPFYWTFTSQSQALIDIDTDHPHSGRRSLRIVFSAPTKLETISISQTIVVQPNSQYRFAYFVRTRDLKTGSAPQIALLDVANNANFVQSAPAPTGTNDWQEISCDFRTKPTTQAIKLMMYRESCGEAQLCPIFGKVWYDDFNLQRSGGAIASR